MTSFVVWEFEQKTGNWQIPLRLLTKNQKNLKVQLFIFVPFFPKEQSKPNNLNIEFSIEEPRAFLNSLKKFRAALAFYFKYVYDKQTEDASLTIKMQFSTHVLQKSFA